MKHYSYKAINENGRYVNGKISAANPADLSTILRANALDLISYKEAKQKSAGFFDRVKSADLITIFIHLEQLDRAGVSIVDSINDLKESSSSVAVKNLMREIHEAIKNGSLFSASMAKHPDVFNSTYVGLIAMGEKTGNLSNSFASIIEDIKWNLDIKRKTRKALIGPSFALLMIFSVMIVMTTIVVPKVTGFLLTQGLKLPPMTVALIAFSNFFQSYWKLIVLSIPAFFIFGKIVKRYPDIYSRFDAFKLKIPIIGSVISKIESAKFCQFFAITFKSGLGVIDCLESANQVIKNHAIKRSIAIIKQQVSEGKSLSDSIALSGYFPSMVVRMFKIGEESGNMESALQNIKFFYDREINDSIDRLVGMIQPTLTIFMGGMIAWITIAVFGPIYGTFSAIR